MKLAALPRNIREHLADGVLDTFMGIGGNHQEILEAAIFQALEESIPSRLRFVIEHAEAENFTVLVLVCPMGDQESFCTPGIVLEDKSLERDIAMPGHR